MFAVAALLNYPWERAQASLYVGKDSSDIVWWLCFLATLADGLLVLLISAVGRIVLHRPDWFEQPGIRGYLLMLGTGLIISISVEWMTVYVLKWWAYRPEMLLLPWLGVGLAPVAQMLLLPPLIFRIVAVWRSP